MDGSKGGDITVRSKGKGGGGGITARSYHGAGSYLLYSQQGKVEQRSGGGGDLTNHTYHRGIILSYCKCMLNIHNLVTVNTQI